jgi:squalene-hopene/tetraprenyl-beta-curcumene cyclase
MSILYNSIKNCLSYLKNQRKIRYPDAVHKMLFPRIAARSQTYDMHEGFIFQRALICDALLDAFDAGFDIDKRELIEDVNLLIRSVATDVEGGWRYFQYLNILPPDSDDLAQVLQVILRTGLKTPEFVYRSIDLLFTQGAHVDGSFETWIIDKNNPSEVNKMIIWSVENMWGKGPDVDVMANLLYSLKILDSKKYDSKIEKGCEFIIKSQTPFGYWNSDWYIDRFYSVFVCARLISLICPNSNCLYKTYKFLLDSQKSNGSWGDGEGDPLQTSLALIGLFYIMPSINTNNQVTIDKGIKYILDSQSDKGFWKSSPFIKMNTNRALNQKNIGTPNLITYESNTITSTFCLKALSKSLSQNYLSIGDYTT